MSKNIHLLTCDVLIIGGGSAGLAAAITASRKGASVVLLEKNSFLGGKATAAYVGTICGLYFRSDNPASRYVCDGFAVEFAEKLKFKSSMQPISNKHGLHFLPYSPFDFKLLCDEFISENNISVFFHSVVSSVKLVENKIEEITAWSYDRPITIKANKYIDCSGEAILSTLTNADIIESEIYQAPAQVFSMSGVNATNEINLGLIILKEIQKAISENILSNDFTNVSIVPGSLISQQVYLKIGIPVSLNNDLNKITPLEVQARSMIKVLSDFLIKNLDEFKSAYLSDIAQEVGVRTNRRHKGFSILTKEDVLQCVKLDSSAAKGAWPIEFWDLGKRVKMDFFEKDDYYDISIDCLKSSKISNLLFAGKNISATEEAIASARVIGTCLQLGESAGKMAVI